MHQQNDADVIVIGAGGGGAVVAKELGEKGIKVLVLEAGPWYGNKNWSEPNASPGGISSSSYDDLSIDLLKHSFTDLEDDMNNLITGKLRWGPANRNSGPWLRMGGLAWQNSGVGGSTLHYFGNCPRAYPSQVDNIWPISYQELVPYYEKVEATLPVYPAPTTQKEELFYYGAKKAGWQYLKGKEVTDPGYRPQPNAILQPNPLLMDPGFDLQNNRSVGCTLRGHCINGCHTGPTVEAVAKRSTMASYIPGALRTGNVEVRPNTFATKVLTEGNSSNEMHAVGVMTRDTWSGEVNEFKAKVIVMCAGGVETPRLWLNSDLPENPWVGKGLVTHWFDGVTGIFSERDLMNSIGTSDIKPFAGQNAAARFDYPGLGVIMTVGFSPGLFSSLTYASSSKGYSFINQRDAMVSWDEEGEIVGEQLKESMRDYTRTLSLTIFTDDTVNQQNGISIHPELKDENGYIPVINYTASKEDIVKRDRLAVIAADLLRAAGAKTIIRSNWPPGIFIHIMSTMRMSYVTDINCEALQVKQLFIADNSVLFNGLGGPNPTLTTQALATRTAEKIVQLYFS
jgi:choline dehydrogenase-like flavoprotein